MDKLTYAQKRQSVKEKLLAIQPETLVEMLLKRGESDQGLWRYLETISEASTSSTPAKWVKLTKMAIDNAFGADLDVPDASFHLPELYSAQNFVEELFNKEHYKEVLELVEYSLQYEENLLSPCEPDDLLQDAYNPLLTLWIKAQLKLLSAPPAAAILYKQLAERTGSSLFYQLPYLADFEGPELKAFAKAYSAK